MQGIFLVITLSVLGANLLVDLLYSVIDPRTRARSEASPAMILATQAAEAADADLGAAAGSGRRRSRLPPMTGKLAAGLIIGGLILLFGLIGPFFVQDPTLVHDRG